MGHSARYVLNGNGFLGTRKKKQVGMNLEIQPRDKQVLLLYVKVEAGELNPPNPSSVREAALAIARYTDLPVIIVPEGLTVGSMDEADMKDLGWVRSEHIERVIRKMAT